MKWKAINGSYAGKVFLYQNFRIIINLKGMIFLFQPYCYVLLKSVLFQYCSDIAILSGLE